MLSTRWFYLLRRFGLLLGIYFVLRLLFLICNHGIFAGLGFIQIATAFLYGLRFDLSTLMAINFVFILLTFLPRSPAPKPAYELFVKALFLILNILFLVINIIDLEFFQFTGRRLTFQRLALAGDAGVKWTTLVMTYWPLALLGVFLMALLVLLYGRMPASRNPTAKPTQLWIWALNLVLLFPLAVLCFRGGLQWRPISPAQAMALNHPSLAQLALNSSFTVLKSYRNKTVVRRHYFQTREAMLQVLGGGVQEGERLLPEESRKDNVVILILESFSAEYWGAGNGGNRYTPFLDSLASQSLF